VSLASRKLFFSMMRTLNVWLGISAAAGVIIQYSDRLIAAKVISLSAVTTMSLTDRVYMLALMMVGPLITTANPGMGQMIGAGRFGKAYKTYKRLLLLATGLGISSALAFWSGNSVFVINWVGPDNYGGRWVDLALMLSFVVTIWLMPSRMALFVTLQARPLAMTRTVEAILNIGLSIWFAFEFGIVGVPAATVLAALITSSWYLPMVVGRYFRRGSSALIAQITYPLLIPILFLVPTAILMRLVASIQKGYTGAVLAIAVVMLVGLFSLWRWTFDTTVKRKLLQSFNLLQILNAGKPQSAGEKPAET
jgi:Na+-driven multidrug efflux pump